MDKINIPIKKSDVTLVLQNSGLANYFEASEAFSEMISNGSIKETSEEKYSITPQGKIIVEELERIIPRAVRDKAVIAVISYLERIRAEKENKVIIRKNDRGFTVTCIISDNSFEMLKLTLYAPNRDIANSIKNTFYKDPSELYSKILYLFTE